MKSIVSSKIAKILTLAVKTITPLRPSICKLKFNKLFAVPMSESSKAKCNYLYVKHAFGEY